MTNTFRNYFEILDSAIMRKRREERQNSPMHLPLAMKMMMTRGSRLDFRLVLALVFLL
jgi:hypothetical protein